VHTTENAHGTIWIHEHKLDDVEPAPKPLAFFPYLTQRQRSDFILSKHAPDFTPFLVLLETRKANKVSGNGFRECVLQRNLELFLRLELIATDSVNALCHK
jgi:hypothetical protein